jgi:Tfp pilus assembly protein PilO
MQQFTVPIILVALAVGLFAIYTNPAYQADKGVLVDVRAYNDALTKSRELREVRDEKIAAFNTFKPEDKDRLQRVLPDNVDNIHLIIDINNIAARHGLALKNVTLGTISDSPANRNALAVGSSGNPVGSVTLGFTVAASYDDMLTFITDLEHSLRVMDIEKIDFTAQDKDLTDYSFSIRTYWLH